MQRVIRKLVLKSDESSSARAGTGRAVIALAALAVVCVVCTNWWGRTAIASQPMATEDSSASASRADASDNWQPAIAAVLADVNQHAEFYSIRWSEPLLRARQEFLTTQLASLVLRAKETTTPATRVDFILLRNFLRSEIAETELLLVRHTDMASLLPFAGAIAELELARGRMEPVEPRAAAEKLVTIAKAIKAVEAGLSRGAEKPSDADALIIKASAAPANEPARLTPSATTALRASKAIGSLQGTLRTWFDDHAGFVPEFEFWCRTPYSKAEAAMTTLARRLREDVAKIKGEPEDPLIGDPIGRENLLSSLRNEFVALSPEELIALGDAELAWCQIEMKKAAAELGLADDWRAALEQAKGQVEPIGMQNQYVRDVSREAIEFVTSRDLVGVPELARKLWRTDMLSPARQRVLPFAAYGGQSMLVAYAHAAMEHEDKLMAMRGNNRHNTRLVVPHELIPGHHLQAFMSARNRAYRGAFSTPFYVEGWALYWEMKLWDLGWAKSALDRVGMLFWRMHRCARITVSLKFHLGQMTPQEMVDFLVREVGHERANATAEVRRFIGEDYGPLYQAGYMIGGQQLRQLHRELVSTGTFAERDFNDTVLRGGPIPIELLRAQMMGQVLPPDAEAEWRFER